MKRTTQCPLAAGIKKFSSHCRQRCNPSPEIFVGLGMFGADRFNFDHFLRLKPGRFRPENASTAMVSDHINSHRQTWNTWKHWFQRVLESKWNGVKAAINHQKLSKKCLLTSLETPVQFANRSAAFWQFANIVPQDRDGMGRLVIGGKPPVLKSNPIIEGNLLFHTTFQQYIPYKRYGK